MREKERDLVIIWLPLWSFSFVHAKSPKSRSFDFLEASDHGGFYLQLHHSIFVEKFNSRVITIVQSSSVMYNELRFETFCWSKQGNISPNVYPSVLDFRFFSHSKLFILIFLNLLKKMEGTLHGLLLCLRLFRIHTS